MDFAERLLERLAVKFFPCNDIVQDQRCDERGLNMMGCEMCRKAVEFREAGLLELLRAGERAVENCPVDAIAGAWLAAKAAAEAAIGKP